MKIDFRKIQVKDITGKAVERDLSKDLGTMIFDNTLKEDELEIGRDIYNKGEIEINKARAIALKEWINKGFKAFVKISIIPALDMVINGEEKPVPPKKK